MSMNVVYVNRRYLSLLAFSRVIDDKMNLAKNK